MASVDGRHAWETMDGCSKEIWSSRGDLRTEDFCAVLESSTSRCFRYDFQFLFSGRMKLIETRCVGGGGIYLGFSNTKDGDPVIRVLQHYFRIRSKT